MSWRVPFGPLLHALTGGRFPALTHGEQTGISPLGGETGGLLAQLGLPPRTFDELLAANSLHPHFHYRPFSRPKKGGGYREIVEPDVKLKQVQREILTRYLAMEPPHPSAIAYRKKQSIANHVWPHVGAEVLVTADVQDFFPSTHEGRVRDWWHERVGDDLARLLTLLTTYRGELPQGAPTSPSLSNLLNRELDERLTQRAIVAGSHYTRYCDDMVFSWRHDPGPPSDFENGVRGVLHEYGYTLHPEKGWRVHHRRDEPAITGLILTRHGRVRLPDDLRQAMRVLARSNDPADVRRLAGYQGYEAMVTRRPPRASAPRASRPTPVEAPRAASPPSRRPAPDDIDSEIPF